MKTKKSTSSGRTGSPRAKKRPSTTREKVARPSKEEPAWVADLDERRDRGEDTSDGFIPDDHAAHTGQIFESPHALHPGEILLEHLHTLAMTQSDLARKIHCKFGKVNEIINGKRGITAAVAIELADVFSTTTAAFWLNVQASYDLSQALKKRAKAKRSA